MAKISVIQFKRGSAAALTNYLNGEHRLLAGEPAFEKDTGKLKIGNGVQDYADLPYVGKDGGGGDDQRFVIHDPLENQVLLYDSITGKWVNKNLADKESIIYLAEHGLVIKGYETADYGQMLVKDKNNGLSWQFPVSSAELDAKVAQAESYKVDAANAAASATSRSNEAALSASRAAVSETNVKKYVEEGIPRAIDKKIQTMTIVEYNELEEITPDCIYLLSH